MPKKENRYDCVMVETFFETITSELLRRTVFCNRDEAEQAMALCIDGFHKPVRRHAALDYTSPAKFVKAASG